MEAQEDCTPIETIGPETTDQRLGPFEINGDTVRVSGEARGLDENIDPVFNISLVDEEGLSAGLGASINQAGSFEENILTEPGTYSLEIETFSDTEYTITVADCGSSPPSGPSEGTNPSPPPQPSPTPSPSAPPTPQPTPQPAPSPAPRPEPAPLPEDSGTLMEAGGPEDGPIPKMPGGGCPEEFPVEKDGACYR